MNRTQLIRGILGAVGAVLGPSMLALQRRRNVAPILLYHRVSTKRDAAYEPLAPSVFEEHCAFLAKNFHVLPLDELVLRMRTGKPTRGCCAISFDDGYRDFLEHAYPILRRHSLPAARFLVADSVEGGLPPWTYRLNRLARALTWTGREQQETMQRLGAMTASDRYAWLTREEEAIAGAPSFPRMLNASDIRSIGSSLVEWGSHTTSHAFLDRSPAAELDLELRASKARLETATRTEIRFLAYPNGYFNDAAIRSVEASGYDAAFTVLQDLVTARTPRFALPRVDAGSVSTRMLALEVTGVVESVRRLRPR